MSKPFCFSLVSFDAATELIARRTGATIGRVKRDLFAYGSLMMPDVMTAVARQSVEFCPAILLGYRRACLHGLPYPGIRRSRSGSVDGLLYRGLGRLAFARLDRFEDAFYRRVRVSVSVAGDAVRPAYTYVIALAHYRQLAPEPWSLQDFRRYAGKAYLRRIRRLRLSPVFSGGEARAPRRGRALVGKPVTRLRAFR